MRLLTTLFNFARNISLIIVLAFCCLLGYGLYTGELQQVMEEAKADSGDITLSDDQEDVLVGMMEVVAEADEKIPVQSPTRTYFLRPEEIAYFVKEDGDVSARMISSRDIKYVKNSFKKIWTTLEKQPSHPFFFTQQYIINCRFVKGYYTKNQSSTGSYYVHFAVLENGEELQIPKAKYQEFLKKMESFTISIPVE